VQKGTDDMYVDPFCRLDPIEVSVRPGWEVSKAEDCLTGERFELRGVDGRQEFTVPGLTSHRIVRLGRA